jgi:hypothetical protein
MFSLKQDEFFCICSWGYPYEWCQFGCFHSSRMNSFVFVHGVIHMNGMSLDVFTQAGWVLLYLLMGLPIWMVWVWVFSHSSRVNSFVGAHRWSISKWLWVWVFLIQAPRQFLFKVCVSWRWVSICLSKLTTTELLSYISKLFKSHHFTLLDDDIHLVHDIVHFTCPSFVLSFTSVVAKCCGFVMSAKDHVVIAISWFSVQDTTCGTQ